MFISQSMALSLAIEQREDGMGDENLFL